MSANIGIERPRTEGNVRVFTAAEALQEKERKAAEKKAEVLRKREERASANNEKKIAEILEVAEDIRRMIREMREVVETIVADGVLLKDKVANLFKLMRCAMYVSDEIGEVDVPTFPEKCTLCGAVTFLHEAHLWLDDDLKAAWMCAPCRNGLSRSMAFKERLTMVRQEIRAILDGLMKRDDPELNDLCRTLTKIFDKMAENSRYSVTARSEAEDEEDEEAKDEREAMKPTQLAIWEEVEANLPTYEFLKALDTLTKQLPNTKKVRLSVKTRYMQFFPEQHESSLVQKSVDNRNTASKERCRMVGKIPQSLTLEEAMAAWLQQERRCAICDTRCEWNRLSGGPGTFPQIDRTDVAVESYVSNFSWVCSFCNRMKGYFVELRRYDEFALETLHRFENGEARKRDLLKEIERQSMRQTYVKAVLKERAEATRALKQKGKP